MEDETNGQGQTLDRAQTRDMPMQTREAAVAPATINVEARTVEVMWGTGAAVRRMDPWTGHVFDEVLSMESSAVRMDRLNSGTAPLLDSHFRWGVDSQLGVVQRAWLDKGQGRAVIRFPTAGIDARADALWAKIADGIVSNVSVGYRTLRVEVDRSKEVPIYRAVDWEPMEISLVPVPAEQGAGTRAAPTAPCSFSHRAATHNPERSSMEEDEKAGGQAAATETRAQPAPSAATAAPAQADAEQVRAQARTEERERIGAIRANVRAAGLDEAVAEDMITRGISVADANADILRRMAERSAGSSLSSHVTVGHSNEDPAVMRGRMAEAAACRYTGAAPSDAAREFTGLSMARMAGMLLEARGERVGRMRDHEIIERALGTSDFPILLQATGDRMLLPSYEAMPATFQAIARRITNRDFRTRNLVRDGDFPALLPLNEHGELKEGAMSESQESVTLKTVGRRLRLTRQALVNDDLGAFADLASKAGQASRNYENETVWSVVTTNAKLSSDGKALFHADHANLAGAGGVIAAGTVGDGKKAIRTQKNGDGKTLNYAPSTIVVPAALETTVEQYLSNLVLPTKPSDVVPASHKQLTPVVEPLLDAASATAWYLFCDPSRLAAIVYAYLEGQEGPKMLQDDVSLLGITFDVVLDFAAAPVEYRAAYKNPGA